MNTWALLFEKEFLSLAALRAARGSEKTLRGHSFSGRMRDQQEGRPLNLRDYLDAAVTASNTARNLILILVVSSVIIAIGTIDTLEHGWAADRLKSSNTIDSACVKGKLGGP